MKRIALVVSFALASVPAAASAQIGFGLSAGLAMPMSDFSNGFDNGYHVQGSLSISPPLSPVGFRIDGTYDRFVAHEHVTPGANTLSGSAALTGGSADVVYGLGGLLVGPYVLGGVGYYHTALTSTSTLGTTSASSTSSNNNPGFNFGAGMKIGIGDLGATIEARYVLVTGNNGNPSDKFIPITVGISF